ncbi:MAG: DUF2480 family protein [Flavobacteriales bacterium]|nr:DUF2480 family protein [Flavobacteriales bacterium]
MEEPIVNKVAQSGLITLDLEEFKPATEEVVGLDLADFLFQRLILKEKDFREQVKNTSWETYTGKCVALFCSEDAIIPLWAYMLITTTLNPFANRIEVMHPDALRHLIWKENVESGIKKMNLLDQRVVIKGCGDELIPASIFVTATSLLVPQVKSLMYGEPCSTVPVFKKGT